MKGRTFHFIHACSFRFVLIITIRMLVLATNSDELSPLQCEKASTVINYQREASLDCYVSVDKACLFFFIAPFTPLSFSLTANAKATVKSVFFPLKKKKERNKKERRDLAANLKRT